MGWFIVMGFYFVVMMLLKSRVPGSRRLQKMPILIMSFAALFWIGYSMRLYNCDLTVTDILIIVLLLESAIQGGLLPSNTNYGAGNLSGRTEIPEKHHHPLLHQRGHRQDLLRPLLLSKGRQSDPCQ